MITYRFLEGTRIETLHEAFLGVFADYQVKMDIPLDRFNEMLLRRGYDENISIGAFSGERLVGVVLNGLRNRNGVWTAYDLGTGVVQDFRRQGLTSEMLRLVLNKLQKDSVSRYLLEVLADNSSAIALYTKHGFRKERVLNCYRKDLSEPASEATRTMDAPGSSSETNVDIRATSSTWEIRKMEHVEPERFMTFCDFVPSWQNDSGAINAIPGIFRCAAAFDGDDIVGYAILSPRSGDVPQIAVHRDHRRRGIGTSLLEWMARNTEAPRISILNVDADCQAANEFLRASGFDLYVVQHEMVWTHS
ncbi:GNAT family N-acetyltransferase [Paenibacillus sp. CAU 1782]